MNDNGLIERIRNILRSAGGGLGTNYRTYHDAAGNLNEEHVINFVDNDDISSSIFLDIFMNSTDRHSCFLKNLKKHQLLKIKEIGYKKIKDLDQLSDKTCSICLDDYCLGEYKKTLKCSHIFHKKCIDRWFKKDHLECPLCREKIIN
jgi:hypothetical protein